MCFQWDFLEITEELSNISLPKCKLETYQGSECRSSPMFNIRLVLREDALSEKFSTYWRTKGQHFVDYAQDILKLYPSLVHTIHNTWSTFYSIFSQEWGRCKSAHRCDLHSCHYYTEKKQLLINPWIFSCQYNWSIQLTCLYVTDMKKKILTKVQSSLL